MCSNPLRARWITALLLTALAVSACSSGDETTTADSSLPSTTAAAGQQSGAPDPVATVDSETATTVVQPEATTTTTTTTTTAPTIPVLDDGRSYDPVFDPILDELAQQSGVPAFLPEDAGLGDDTDIQATLAYADADGYVIYLGFGPDCQGGNACRVASYTGRLVPEDESHDDAPTGVVVPLPGDRTGAFFDATCGANCGDGTVQWMEGDIRYSVGEKLGAGPAMLELAWASIDPTATPPSRPTVCGEETIRDEGRVARILSDGSGLHWLTTCSADGIRVELAQGPGRLSWFDLDGDGSRDLALTMDDDDSTMLFSLVGIEIQAVTNFDTFDRLRVDDIHCMDLDGDGRREIIAGDGTVYEFINPVSVIEADTTVDNVDSFDRCF